MSYFTLRIIIILMEPIKNLYQTPTAPRRPVPRGFQLVVALTTPWGFPCCVRFPCVHAAATTPAQRPGVLVPLIHPAVSAFPENPVGSVRPTIGVHPQNHRCPNSGHDSASLANQGVKGPP